jgi:hypothetical protein
MRLHGGKFVERGQGNHVSVEFNLLYRVSLYLWFSRVCADDKIVLVESNSNGTEQWHATLSQPDTKWMEQILKRAFPDKPLEAVRLELPCFIFSLFIPALCLPTTNSSTYMISKWG